MCKFILFCFANIVSVIISFTLVYQFRLILLFLFAFYAVYQNSETVREWANRKFECRNPDCGFYRCATCITLENFIVYLITFSFIGIWVQSPNTPEGNKIMRGLIYNITGGYVGEFSILDDGTR